jgi:hypothetical protein
VATASFHALDQAEVLALQALAAGAAPRELKANYTWALPEAEARLHPVAVSPELMQAAPGAYGNYVISSDRGGLTIMRPGHLRGPLQNRSLLFSFTSGWIDRDRAILLG